MNDKVLKIDSEFRMLFCEALTVSDYMRQEKELREKKREPTITVWNDSIIDGFTDYEICVEKNIPFVITTMDFDCREAAMSWMCKKYLVSSNLTEEKRKLLIGTQYLAEKMVLSKRKKRGKNRYLQTDSPDMERMQDSNQEEITPAINRIAAENSIVAGTVVKYSAYARALREIERKEPQVFLKIIMGQYKISHENVVAISKLSEAEIKNFGRMFSKSVEYQSTYRKTRELLEKASRVGRSNSKKKELPSIKIMPEFDPEAEVVGLSLTIPSWNGTIQRVQNNTDFSLLNEETCEEFLDNVDIIIGSLEEIKKKVFLKGGKRNG